MGLFVSTTSSNVEIEELGITITHPTVDKDLSSQFSAEEIKGAESLTSAIHGGLLLWKRISSGSSEVALNYDPDFVELEQGNTGTGENNDLSVLFKDMVAPNIPFSHPQFTATDVAAAILEAKLLGEGFGRVPLVMSHNGTLGNNDEIGRNNLISDKKYITPVNFKLTHLTWNNSRANRSFDLEFYRYNDNNVLYPSQPFFTYEVRGKRFGFDDSLDYSFVAGDYFKIIYIDQGKNAADFEGDIWGTRI